MSYIQLDNPFDRDFAMVPDVLWKWPGLSFKAKGFFAYLLSFRHGVCPAVAAMEAQTGLGRDARKAVMRELQAAGLARWHIERDASGRVLAKRLEVTTRPLLAAVLLSDGRATEKPSHGVSRVHATEKPSDGKPVAVRRKIRASATENPAIKEKEKDKGAAAGSAKPGPRQTRRQPPEGGGAADAVKASATEAVAKLTPFERSRVRLGASVVLDGQHVAAGSARMAALQADLAQVERGATGAFVALGGVVAAAGDERAVCHAS